MLKTVIKMTKEEIQTITTAKPPMLDANNMPSAALHPIDFEIGERAYCDFLGRVEVGFETQDDLLDEKVAEGYDYEKRRQLEDAMLPVRDSLGRRNSCPGILSLEGEGDHRHELAGQSLG